MKWEWFVGGKFMFWVSIIAFAILLISFISAYIIDPTSALKIKSQDVDTTSIEEISENYVKSLKVEVNRPIIYRFVRYTCDEGFASEPDSEILLGTFHEWNGVYYIDISIDLYKMNFLSSVVIHETRHMLVEYLKDEKIINLSKYTEQIAEQYNNYYNNLFDSGIYLLRLKQEKP